MNVSHFVSRADGSLSLVSPLPSAIPLVLHVVFGPLLSASANPSGELAPEAFFAAFDSGWPHGHKGFPFMALQRLRLPLFGYRLGVAGDKVFVERRA